MQKQTILAVVILVLSTEICGWECPTCPPCLQEKCECEPAVLSVHLAVELFSEAGVEASAAAAAAAGADVYSKDAAIDIEDADEHVDRAEFAVSQASVEVKASVALLLRAWTRPACLLLAKNSDVTVIALAATHLKAVLVAVAQATASSKAIAEAMAIAVAEATATAEAVAVAAAQADACADVIAAAGAAAEACACLKITGTCDNLKIEASTCATTAAAALGQAKVCASVAVLALADAKAKAEATATAVAGVRVQADAAARARSQAAIEAKAVVDELAICMA